MKRIKFLYTLIIATFVASSCTDFVEPAIPYNNFETGTYLKTITAPTPINFFDIDNAKFTTLLECHAIDKKNNVKTVDVFVKHRRGNTLSQEVSLGSVDGSAFTNTADSQWPRGSVSFTVPQALTKLGYSKTNIRGGDFLEFRLVLTTLDGKTFTNNNLSADVSGGTYYSSPFFYRVAVVCPSALGGTYEFSTTDISAGPGGDAAACGGTFKGTVTLKASTVAGEYEVSDGTFGVFECAWGDTPPGGTIRFTDACGKLGMKGTDKYGDAYSLTFVSSTAKTVTFKWKNTYGDGGTTTLTRSTGDFPAGLN
jgi:hypothetical protein